MGFSTSLRTIILAVFGVTCVMGGPKIADMGPCKQYKGVHTSFSFNDLGSKNNGKWHYAVVPKESLFDNVKSATIQFTSAGSGLYDVNIENTLKNGRRESFSSGRLAYQGNGYAMSASTTATTSGQNQYQYYYLAQGQDYVFYVVCSKEGGNNKLDYRNLITTRKFSDAEIKTAMSTANRFAGATMKLTVP